MRTPSSGDNHGKKYWSKLSTCTLACAAALGRNCHCFRNVFDFLSSWPLQTNTLAWSYIMLITSTWGIMNIQWGLNSATVERNSWMCGVTSHDLQWEKKGASHYARLSFLVGERIFENMPFYSQLEVAENSNRKFWLNGKRPKHTSSEIYSRNFFCTVTQ